MLTAATDTLSPGSLLAGPLYVEVKKRITRSVMDGEWPQGAPIPSESRLAQRYAVSMGTVRKAIGELVAERILVRQPGRGTFVANHNRDYMLEAFFHIVDERGRKEFPASEMLSFRRGKADALAARHLELSEHEPIFQIENLLRLQGKPVIFDRIRVPRKAFPGLSEALFRDRDKTIFGLYQSGYGVTVTRLEEWIRAADAGDKLARMLSIAAGEAVLKIERVAYTYDNIPVEFRERFVNTRSHAYVNILGARRA